MARTPRKNQAERKQAAADALREAFPRLAFTVERLDLLDDALRHLDDQSAQAADLYGTDPQQAALILIRALASLHYSARPQQPPILDLLVPARGTEILDGLLEAFAELKRGRTHPLVAVERRAGAPMISREQEAFQFWAAAAAECRILAGTGKSVADVCREIAKELRLPRDQAEGIAKSIKEWRRVIKQGRRGDLLKRNFEYHTRSPEWPKRRSWVTGKTEPSPQDKESVCLANAKRCIGGKKPPRGW